MTTPFRNKIMDALTQVLQRNKIPHTGVGTDKPKHHLVGVVYMDQVAEKLPKSVRNRIPARISVNWGNRVISVGVQCKNIGQPAPGG